MQAAEYSDLKPALHPDKIAALRAGLQPVPAQIQLVLSDLCNHDCPWCAYRTEGYNSNQHFGEIRPGGTVNNNPARFMPTDKAKAILSDAAGLGVRAVQFTGGGEPTVHPDHMDVFRTAVDLGLECALVTNGCLLRDGWAAVLSRFSWVRVSMDAATPRTYAAIRRVKEQAFGTMLSNLAAMACAGVPCLTVSFIVMRDNVAECAAAARTARACGATAIRFAALFSPEMGSYYTGWEEVVRDRMAEAAAEAGPGFRVIDMVSQRMDDLRAGAPDYSRCGYQHFNVYIGADQNVYRCCDTAYNDRGLVGSIKDQAFSQFWLSENKMRKYGEFDARSCNLCAFNGKNRVINYLTDVAEAHVNFV